jgi:type I restriction-modification system DNA methylase subunit
MPPNSSGANLGFEAKLWDAADALRSNMDAAEYKHVVLGLIFLKYISDAFEEQHAKLEAERSQGADPEDPDEYRALNIFWVPPDARWTMLKANARQPTIGQIVDDAMLAIEGDNPTLKGVLPKDFARLGLDKQRLGQLIDLVSNIGLGDKESRSKDVLGLGDAELAFYDALEVNDSAVQVLGDATLKLIAQELAASLRRNVTIDWTVRESVRAKLRVLVKRILRSHGYPPDKQEKATQTVIEQAEVLAGEWIGGE